MGLSSQLPVTLLCLLAGTAHFIQGRRSDIILPEIIKTLNILTERKTPCTKLTIADALAVPKNTTEREAVCGAATALRQFYLHHRVSWCFKKHGEPGDLGLLRGLDRNLCSMAKLSNCPGKEGRQTTLEDFLDRLKTAMQEKYSKRQS
uniref:Interleukin-4 n=1 Tax=Lepus europaeus TaxID=9983 RepID=A0A0N9HNL1_LEPEU|nr:interleukin 4 [Lepus europaeus]ALG04614.1 interleukin 4 [Lepus europaeus]